MPDPRPSYVVLRAAVLLCGLGWIASATAGEPTEAPAMPEGLVPLIDYSGDLWTRPRLTGDWYGSRTDLAERGIRFDVDLSQTLQSVVDGGRDTDTRYGGSADYLLFLDLHRMGYVPGAFVKIRAESRFGGSVNGIAGPILPVNTDGFFPLTDELDEDIEITVTNFTYYQFLSPQFGLLVGKIDTLDADPNEFASGRGNTQFMNAHFLFSPEGSIMVPYSTLAAGAIAMPTKWLTVASIFMNTDDSSTTAGFDDFGDGWTWTTEAQFKYRLGDLPGGQNIGFIYAADRNFFQIGSARLVFQRGQGLSVGTESDDETWAAYWSAWQYLYVEEPSDAPIDLTDGRPDRQGIGLFARAGMADRDTNPIEWSVSGGVGGRGIIPGRDDDVLGVGYYYTQLQSEIFTQRAGRLGKLPIFDPIGVDNHTQGFEAFYNIALTPAAHLTFDVQVVDSAFPRVDTAVILGGRLLLSF